MKKLIAMGLLATLLCSGAENISGYLTSISITIRAESGFNRAEGSGTLFRRKVGKRDVVFCHTAAHVIEHMRSVREEIVDGKPRKVVEFGEPLLVRKLRNPDTGRIVGETAVSAKVIRYSDSETGHDLALLQALAKSFKVSQTARFYDTNATLVPLGTHLWSCSSLRGTDGANSITDGILSQHGRILFRSTDFTQVTTVAFPGSSGSGNFNDKGEYIGMLTRGTQTQGFNFLVPIKRMRGYYDKSGMAWCMDAAVAVTQEDIDKLPIEDTVGTRGGGKADAKSFPFHLKWLQREK